MKKILTFFIMVLVLGAGWYLLSPLFIDTTVDEPLLVGVTPIDSEDIIVGQDITIDESMNDMPVGSEELNITNAGEFTGADARHKGSGQLKIVRDMDRTFLRFEDFSVTNGPDLFVTLNKGIPQSSEEFGEHVIVERLKGNKGNQNYDVSEYDLSEYDSVSIYCKNFSTLFATASL